MATKANESSQVKKYRKKLEESIIEEKKLINPESLDKMKASIHEWINKHSGERINLKTKNVELFDENQKTTKSSDCYSFGVVIWECCTHQSPWSECENVQQINKKVCVDNIKLRTPTQVECPLPHIMKLITRCTKKDPNERSRVADVMEHLQISFQVSI